MDKMIASVVLFLIGWFLGFALVVFPVGALLAGNAQREGVSYALGMKILHILSFIFVFIVSIGLLLI